MTSNFNFLLKSSQGLRLFKDYRDHDFPNTEFFKFLTIDTRQ